MKFQTSLKRVYNLLYSNSIRFFSVYGYKNWYKWKKLKGFYAGERIFLIANGPSLNFTPLYLLKDENTIMFNRITLMLERLNFIPTFYMIVDGLAGKTSQEDIRYFVGKNRMVITPDITKSDHVRFMDFVPFKENVYYVYEEPAPFSHYLPFVNNGNTVIYAAFQVLKYLGFSEVYVVGNDMNYVLHTTVEVMSEHAIKGRVTQNIRSQQDDDPNHFDPRYFGKGKEYHQPTQEIMDSIFRGLDRVAVEYQKAGIKVVNAGYNSKVKSFPKQDFYEALGYSQEKIDILFDDLVKSKGLVSKEWLLTKAVQRDDDWNEELDVVSVPMEIATVIVKKKVLDYLPLGPYRDRLYFINRKIIETTK